VFKEERKQYDRHLAKDKERLMYINNYQQTKRLVHLSYVNELKRMKDRMTQDNLGDKIRSQMSHREDRATIKDKKHKLHKSMSLRRKITKPI